MTMTMPMSEERQSTDGPGEWELVGPPDTRRRSIIDRVFDPAEATLTYLGVLVVVAGFALIAIGWSAVAGKVDVWRQMPYVLSAGLPGIGLVMTGLVIVNVAVRRRDADNRRRELGAVADALRELRRSLGQ